VVEKTFQVVAQDQNCEKMLENHRPISSYWGDTRSPSAHKDVIKEHNKIK